MRIQNRILRHRVVRRHANHAARAINVFDFADEMYDLRPPCGGRVFRHVGFHRIRIHRRIQRPRQVDARRIDFNPVGRRRRAHIGRAADVGNAVNGRARRKTMRNIHNRAFGIAVNENVGFGIDQH